MSRLEPTYEECYACVLLAEFAECYDIVLCDKPDILDINFEFGVEVTSAIRECEKKLESYFAGKQKKFPGDPYTQIAEGFVVGGHMTDDSNPIKNDSDYTNEDSVSCVIKTIEKKKEKRDNYKIRNCRLFIDIEFAYDEENVLKPIAKKLYEVCKPEFTKLYLNVVNSSILIEVDEYDCKFHYYDDRQRELALKARNLMWDNLSSPVDK